MAKKNLIVGLFVLAALALFTVGLFLIGNRHEAFSRHMDFYAEFTNLAGLTKGAKVQVAGMDAGQILEIGIPASPSSKFRVKVRIDERLHGLVRTDSLATIGTEGVVGNTFVSIGPGSRQAAAAPPLATLRSKEPIELADLLDQAKGTIADVDGTVKNANGLLTTVGGNLNQALFGARTTLSNVNDVVVGLKEGRGSAGMLLRDQALAGQIRETVGNVQQASLNLNRVSVKADSLLTDIQSRSFPQKIDETLASVKDTASNFDASSQQIRQTVNEFTAPDQFGVAAGVNLRDSLSNVNAATGNMADDTEALKHNFLFRPFFRQRGYYNLSHITPDEYRKVHLFANPTNLRVWLPANELFHRTADGTDQLTAAGRALLDQTLSQYGDAIVESPIIVEGYSDGGTLADRLAISRDRSILVRTYILNHFHSNADNLGSIAMEDRPPSGLDHSTWDGVAVVVLKPKP
jgi:phospholipid/cholesterol/gamma-HCH transport system substrate-binding protein